MQLSRSTLQNFQFESKDWVGIILQFLGLFLVEGTQCGYLFINQDIEKEFWCSTSVRKLGRHNPGFPYFYHKFFDVLKK